MSILSEARKYVKKNKSVAEDSGTPERTTKHWLQRILNSSVARMEISDTQAAAYNLGMESVICSDIFSYYSIWSSIRNIQIIFDSISRNDHMFSAHDNYSDDKIVAENSFCVDKDDPVDDKSNCLADSDDESSVESSDSVEIEEIGDFEGKSFGTKIYEIKENNKIIKIPVLFEHHYLYRGSAFATFNRHEYFTLVRINKGDHDNDKNNEELDNGESFEDFYNKQKLNDICNLRKSYTKGRQSNAKYPFMIGHPLAGTYHQTLTSKQCTCILSGKPPPNYPGTRPNIDTNKYISWKKKADFFATFYIIGFKPNSAFDGIFSYTWDDLCIWIKSSERGSFIERMRIKTVFNVMRGLKIKNRNVDKIMAIWRSRDRHLWSELEQKEANLMKQRENNDITNRILKEMNNIQASNEAKYLSNRTINQANIAIDYVSYLVYRIKTSLDVSSSFQRNLKLSKSSIQKFSNFRQGINSIKKLIHKLKEDEDDQFLNKSKNNINSIEKSSRVSTSHINHKNMSPIEELNLGDDQKKAFDSIMNDLSDDKWSLSLILGLPGTGKSFLVNKITRVASSKCMCLEVLFMV